MSKHVPQFPDGATYSDEALYCMKPVRLDVIKSTGRKMLFIVAGGHQVNEEGGLANGHATRGGLGLIVLTPNGANLGVVATNDLYERFGTYNSHFRARRLESDFGHRNGWPSPFLPRCVRLILHKLQRRSGLELLPKAKALRPDVSIIMITAYGDAETKRQAVERGAEALLTKPIDFGTLRSEIDMRIGRA
jgi:hypothetical protein